MSSIKVTIETTDASNKTLLREDYKVTQKGKGDSNGSSDAKASYLSSLSQSLRTVQSATNQALTAYIESHGGKQEQGDDDNVDDDDCSSDDEAEPSNGSANPAPPSPKKLKA